MHLTQPHLLAVPCQCGATALSLAEQRGQAEVVSLLRAALEHIEPADDGPLAEASSPGNAALPASVTAPVATAAPAVTAAVHSRAASHEEVTIAAAAPVSVVAPSPTGTAL